MSVVKKAFFGAVAAALTMAGVAQASVFQIVPVISAEYTSAGTLDKGALGGAGLSTTTPSLYTPVPGDIYAVDFYLKYTPSAGEPSFGNLTFDVVPSGGATRLGANTGSAKVNYTPVSTLFDNNGAGPDTPELAFNADAGNDWKSVLIGIDNTLDTSSAANGDPRPTIGQSANGFLFGRVFVQVNGTGTVSENLDNALSGSPPSVWLSSTTGQLINPADALVTNGVATFAAVPEPATLGLIGLGAIGLIRRRRQGLTE